MRRNLTIICADNRLYKILPLEKDFQIIMLEMSLVGQGIFVVVSTI